ncbi:TPA: hypothetical protein I7787_18980 [Vibrio vulnificus]|nr:hypothetical protein [Vibrio vulnificus]RZQ84446.1 hypothetical protein D8T27_20820 [Vibrio vulnificus]HAS8478500.1 hypothetical protein [Vibrio vulnificus]HAS8617804.1 hypothetical protein [Vibrio vulnificus]
MIKKTAIMYQILIKNPEICDLFVSIFLLLTLIAPPQPQPFLEPPHSIKLLCKDEHTIVDKSNKQGRNGSRL